MTISSPPFGEQELLCSGCRLPIARSAPVCPHCDLILSQDGVYRGERRLLPGAMASVTWGVLGIVGTWFIVLIGVPLGFVALRYAMGAQQRACREPRFRGEKLALVGYALGTLSMFISFAASVIFYSHWLG